MYSLNVRVSLSKVANNELIGVNACGFQFPGELR